MSHFKILRAEEGTNLVINPSIELVTTGWTAVGGTVARSSSAQRRGLYSLAVDPTTGVNDGCYFGTVSLTSGYPYTFSVDVLGVYGVPYRIYFGTTGGVVKGTPTTFNGTGDWQRVTVYWECDSTASYRPYVVKNNSSNGSIFYVDGAQVERHAYDTTYMDGDQPGCYWTGIAHASTSMRLGTSRAGGRVRDLEDDLDFWVSGMAGVGFPPITNQRTEYAILPGSAHHGTKIQEAVLQLTGTLKGSSLSNLHSRRSDLIDALRPELKSKEPVILQYSGSGTTLELPVHYDAGLSLGKKDGFAEEMVLRFTAPDPFWQDQNDTVLPLDVADTLTVNHVAARLAGLWSNMANGLNTGSSYVYALAAGQDGAIYVGGIFTTAGGVATANVAKWNGTAWSALGAGLTGGAHACFGLAVAPNGDLYATGEFTTAGTVAAVNVAKWNGSAWSALGNGLIGGRGRALAIDADGILYAGGEFTTAGTVAAAKIAKWNGAAWSTMGAGMAHATETPVVNALAVAPDGTIYAGGLYGTAGAVAANGLAGWDGTAWAALAAGLTDTSGVTRVYGLDCDPAGNLYAGGIFTTAGAVAASNVAKWNGSAWSALGAGLDARVDNVVYEPETGSLYAAGQFAASGEQALIYRLAMWTGTAWTQTDIRFPGTAWGGDLCVSDGNLYVGFNEYGTAYVCGATLVPPDCSVEVYPEIIISRSGGTEARLSTIRNATTGDNLYFDYPLADGEQITIDFRPGHKAVISNIQGNVLGNLLPQSDFARFSLIPGGNTLYVFVHQSGAPSVTAFIRWRGRYWGADG